MNQTSANKFPRLHKLLTLMFLIQALVCIVQVPHLYSKYSLNLDLPLQHEFKPVGKLKARNGCLNFKVNLYKEDFGL